MGKQGIIDAYKTGKGKIIIRSKAEVITNEEKQEKIGFGCSLTFPALSIIDPELMISIPPYLTAYQGFDAFPNWGWLLHR